MKTKTLAACVLLAAFGAACSGGGGGSSPAPKPAVSAASGGSGGGSSSTGSTATLPPGTVGVTLNLKIPAHTTAATVRLKASATRKRPAFIQSQTNGVQATVTPASGPAITTSGTCLPAVDPTSCTIVVPVPISVASTVVVQLLENGTPIGQATASFAANQFTDGVAQTYGTTLTFQPLIGSIIVTWSGAQPGLFLQGTASATFAAQLVLEDTMGNDVGNETSGVLDTGGTPITSVTVSGNGFTGGAFPYTINVSAGNPASDIVLSSSLAYDGATYAPDMTPSGSPGTYYSTYPLSESVGYSFTPHGFAVTPPSAWNGNFSIEYPSPQSAPTPSTDTFTMSENIPSDAAYATVFVDVQNAAYDSNSNCASIMQLPGLLSNAVPYYQYLPPLAMSGSVQYTVNYLTGNFNGVCMLEFADGNNQLGGAYGYQDAAISVNNPIVIIQRKARK
jgi:hypothetical protein